MMLQSMRQASESFGTEFTDGGQQGFYQDMFDSQLSLELTKGRGLGLADVLMRQLAKGVPGAQGAVATGGDATSAVPGSDATAAEAIAPANTGLPVVPANFGLAAPAATGGSTATPPTAALDDWRPASREEFIRDLWPHAEAAGRQLGVDPRTLIAHAALETGWGRSIPCGPDGRCSYNLFGVKAGSSWTGSAVGAKTLEFEDGVAVSRRERFRAYGSPGDSFRDYAALLRDNPRYAGALGTGSDTQAFAAALQKAGYATDPDYARKLTMVAGTLDAVTRAAALKTYSGRPISRTGSSV
jgi:flagellar protein FlgJ